MANNNRERNLTIIAFTCLALSTSFNFRKYIYKNKILFFFNYTEELNLEPSLISTLISILLFGGYIIRNLDDILKANIKFIFCIFDLFFFSGLISVFVRSKDNFMGFSPQALLLLMITLMWLGMKSMIRYLFISFVSLTFLYVSHVNDAMGFDGCIYLLSAFVSFLIQLYLNILPKSNDQTLQDDFYGRRRNILNRLF